MSGQKIQKSLVIARRDDYPNKESDHLIVFDTRTDDIDGFDFKVNEDVNVLRLTLQIDGEIQPRDIEAGKNNAQLSGDPVVVDLR